MSPVKKFILGFCGVYLVVAVGVMIALGGPGFSGDYLEQYGREHDRYLEIVKSEPYKLHRENPDLHPAEGALAQEVAFVEEYTSRPEYRAERRRTDIRQLFMDCFNALCVIVLAVRFGWKPLLGFLDAEIAKIKTRLDEAAKARESASTDLAAAEAKQASLDDDKSRIAQQGEDAAAHQAKEIEEGTQQQLAQLDAETEDRKRLEEHRAVMQLKREIVEQSVADLEQTLRALPPEQREPVLIEQFVRELSNARGEARGASA